MVNIKDWEKILKETEENKKKGIVCFDENGDLMTSYKVELDKKSFEELKGKEYFVTYTRIFRKGDELFDSK